MNRKAIIYSFLFLMFFAYFSIENTVLADGKIEIDGVPFEKRYYDFPKFKLYNVEFLVAQKPEKYQDTIMSWFSAEPKIKPFPIKMPKGLSSYNNGNHIVVWYDSSTYSKNDELLVGTMALATAMREEIKKRFNFSPDLYLIDTTNFNNKNKLKAAMESGYYDDSKADKVAFPGITVYHKGYLVDHVMQDETFNIFPKDINPIIDMLYKDPGYSTKLINEVPK